MAVPKWMAAQASFRRVLAAVAVSCLSLAQGACRGPTADQSESPASGGRPALVADRSPAAATNAAGDDHKRRSDEHAQSQADLPVWFVERLQTGVDFVHVSGNSSEKPFPAANGSGVAAIDFDRDGMIDLYFATGATFPLEPGSGPPNRMYRNLGGWNFVDVTDRCGLGLPTFSAGLAVGDFDNDGFDDVYVACYGANELFQNLGDGTFEAVGLSAGVADQRWPTGCAFFDANNDGWLDVYVCNYAKWTWETRAFCGDRARGIRLFCSPHTVEPDDDVFFVNRGDGRFEDRTQQAGFRVKPGRGQGLVAVHVDDDDLIDLYVTNDLNPNFLFIQQADGTFDERGELAGVARSQMGADQAGMGVDAADIDNDGRFDLFVTNFHRENNAYYSNLGGGLFTEASQRKGLAADSLPWVGWGTVFADLDLDGWLDLVVSNGHVDDNRHLLGQDVTYDAPALLWRNNQGRFQLVDARSSGPYFERHHVGRGLALVDLDNDGREDIVITHQDQAAAILQNVLVPDEEAEQRSISIRLIGRTSNRQAIGARIHVQFDQRNVYDQVKGGGSYLSARDLRMVFARLAGEGPGQANIRWPSGRTSTVLGLDRGGQYYIWEPSGQDQAPRVLLLERSAP